MTAQFCQWQSVFGSRGYVDDIKSKWNFLEKALNHSIDAVRGVYNRAEYAQQRKEMPFLPENSPSALLRSRTIKPFFAPYARTRVEYP